MSAKLVFTPYAWAKLLYMRDKGPTEVAGMGITDDENPLYVTDFFLLPQEASSHFVEFDDGAVTEFIDEMLDEDIHPINCARVWIHTHPGNMSTPSGHDEQEFKKVFAEYDFRVMAIVDRSGGSSAHLEYKNPNHRTKIDIDVDFACQFDGTDVAEWDLEYEACVKQKSFFPEVVSQASNAITSGQAWHWDDDGYGYSYTPSGYAGDERGEFSELDNDDDIFVEDDIVDPFLEHLGFYDNYTECDVDRDGCMVFDDEEALIEHFRELGSKS
jgi:hypothetical protein